MVLLSDLLSNSPSSTRCSAKPEITTSPHQLHFIVSCLYTHRRPAFWILFNSNVSNSYYSLDYISPCYLIQNTLNSYMLTHNSLFCEHIVLWEYHPGTTSYPNPRSTLTIKTNSSFGFWWYSSYLSSVGPINQNESIASITYRLNHPAIKNTKYWVWPKTWEEHKITRKN